MPGRLVGFPQAGLKAPPASKEKGYRRFRHDIHARGGGALQAKLDTR
jgi:hypothetical protein